MSDEPTPAQTLNDERIRVFVQSEDFIKGQLTVEMGCDGKPVAAKDFAFLISQTVKCLKSLDETKSVEWAIIEANMIGDLASFTLKGYAKEQFKAKRVRNRNPAKESKPSASPGRKKT